MATASNIIEGTKFNFLSPFQIIALNEVFTQEYYYETYATIKMYSFKQFCASEFTYLIVIQPLYKFKYKYMYIFQNNDRAWLNGKLKSTYTWIIEYT